MNNVEMGDEGFAELVPLVYQGRLDQLINLSLSDNILVSDRGIIALVHGIGAHGLPILHTCKMTGLRELTAVGISEMMQALTRGCPRLVISLVDKFEPDQELWEL
jgi:hypothetical protein